MLAHGVPDIIGDSNTITVQVHAESGNDIGPGAVADGGAQRLAGQHVSAVQLPGDDPVQKHFPVCLCLELHEQALVHEEALLPGNRQRCHVRQFDKAELEVRLFGRANFRLGLGATGPEAG